MKKRLDYNLIVEFYNAGNSAEQVAQKVGCSKYGVLNALRKSDVKLRRGAKRNDTTNRLGFRPTREWLTSLVERNDSAASAACEAGVPYNTFIDWMSRFDISRTRWRGGPRGNTRKQNIPVDEAIKLSDKGVTYRDLAEKYGVSYGVLSKRMKEAGYKPPNRTKKYDDRINGAPYTHRKVLQEIGIFYCEICGEDRTFDLSHIVPRKDGGPTCVENSLVLCPTHHRLFDKEKLTPGEKKKIKRKVSKAKRLFQ